MARPVSHLASLDLNLLVALRELLSERNVTRAAQRLGVTQPAASAALARLRRHFGDELLVRDKGGYALTALAVTLAEQVDAVCGAAERLFAASTHFDPATSEREFTLVMADYTIGVMGEALSQLVHEAAPRARLHIRLVRESLAAEYSGAIRFIDGMVAPPTHGFALPNTRSAELFRDRWVCLVAARNPVLDAGPLRPALRPGQQGHRGRRGVAGGGRGRPARARAHRRPDPHRRARPGGRPLRSGKRS
jgi:DNA-binding transcriptional LysR family regulator